MGKTVIVFGGDGFCGWPTALYLSKHGYDVVIVDNLSRRRIDEELGCESITPIQPIETRLATWHQIGSGEIPFFNIDIAADYEQVAKIIRDFRPYAVVHFAEQRAAPYSMKSSKHKRYTVNNNTNATHNILAAIVETGVDLHLVHLGTMGIYGYGVIDMDIPEGYLPVKVDMDGRLKDLSIPYPASPGSVYHMTKAIDAQMFAYYNQNDGIRITDLHQGVVWGTNTDETLLDERLINRFDYDGDYGTVINRFLMQAAIGYPLTVYGTGGQTRAFIHLRDTVECIRLAIANPAASGEKVRIFNQVTETHRLRDLAAKIAEMTGASIEYLPNPRIEKAENTLRVQNNGLRGLGLNPILLEEGLMEEIMAVARKYANRCDLSKIPCQSKWRSDLEVDDRPRTIGKSSEVEVDRA